jgi:DNA-directed RNA polymerase specialized sigma24 family protein
VGEEPKAISSLTDEEWADIYKRLRLFAKRRFFWVEKKIGVDTDDLVHQAIRDTLLGIRRAPPGINVFVFLCQVIRSEVSHRWDRAHREISLDAPNRSNAERKYDPENLPPDSIETLLQESGELSGGQRDPFLQADFAQLKDEVLALVEQDEELTEIVKLLFEDPQLKPSELAQILGFPMSRMRAAQKRLRRRLVSLREGTVQ